MGRSRKTKIVAAGVALGAVVSTAAALVRRVRSEPRPPLPHGQHRCPGRDDEDWAASMREVSCAS
jgi:hypothetical protein